MIATGLRNKLIVIAAAVILAVGGTTYFFISRSHEAITLALPHNFGGPHAIACQSRTSCVVIGENYLARGGFIGKVDLQSSSITFTSLERRIPVATALACYSSNHCLVALVSHGPIHSLAQFSPSTVATTGVTYITVPSQFQQVNAIYCLSDTTNCLVAGKAAGDYNFAFQLYSTTTSTFIGEPVIKRLSDIGGIYDMSCDQSGNCLAVLENFDGTAGIVDAFSLEGISPNNLTNLSLTEISTPPANLLLTVSCSATNCLVGGSDASSIHGLLIKVDMTSPAYSYQQLTLPKNQGPILAVSTANKIVAGGYPVFSNFGDLATIN